MAWRDSDNRRSAAEAVAEIAVAAGVVSNSARLARVVSAMKYATAATTLRAGLFGVVLNDKQQAGDKSWGS
jgi:hypothetical protein